MSIDLDKLRDLNAGLYTSATRQAFGERGLKVLQDLVSSIVRIYRRVDPALRDDALVIFADVVNAQPFRPTVAPRRVHSIENLGDEIDGPCMVRVNGDNSLDVSPLDPSALKSLSQTSVVYHHHRCDEKFLVNGNEFHLSNPMVGFGSVFCKPTFTNLTTALDRYRTAVSTLKRNTPTERSGPGDVA